MDNIKKKHLGLTGNVCSYPYSCVLSGSCGGEYCGVNAVCAWDNTEGLLYCMCPSNYVGDALKQCDYVRPPCDVNNDCGLNAACAPNYRY